MAASAAAALALGVPGCGSDVGAGFGGGPWTVLAATTGGQLVEFRSDQPGVVTTRAAAITGLNAGEIVVGMDFRPSNKQLYAVTNHSRIVTINTTTGAATPVGPAFAPVLTGNAFGVDFNPVADRLRIVSDTEQNLRVDPGTGALAGTDTALAYVAGDVNAGQNPNVMAAAYTNNMHPPAPATTLYVIDTERDVLARLGGVDGVPSPNTGELRTVGPLGFDAGSDVASYDIAPDGTSLALLTGAGGANPSLYSVSLATGSAVLIGRVGGGVTPTAIAVVP